MPGSWTAACTAAAIVVTRGPDRRQGRDRGPPRRRRPGRRHRHDPDHRHRQRATARRSTLPLDIKAEANAGGEVKVDDGLPGPQRDSSDQTFTFNLNVNNKTDEDLTYHRDRRRAPRLDGRCQADRAASQAVERDGQGRAARGGVTVTVKAADRTCRGHLPDPDRRRRVGTRADHDRTSSVEITGSYTLDALDARPGPRRPRPGRQRDRADVHDHEHRHGAGHERRADGRRRRPTGRSTSIQPTDRQHRARRRPSTVKAQITPSGDAIAGDYNITVQGDRRQARRTATPTIRFTVETSILGAIIGAALIIAAVGGLCWVFRRYGRR